MFFSFIVLFFYMFKIKPLHRLQKDMSDFYSFTKEKRRLFQLLRCLWITHTDLFIPGRHDVLHVDVAGEKRHNPIGNDRRHLQKQVTIIPNHSWRSKHENYLVTRWWKHSVVICSCTAFDLRGHAQIAQVIFTNRNLLWSQTWSSGPPGRFLCQQSVEDGNKVMEIFMFLSSFCSCLQGGAAFVTPPRTTVVLRVFFILSVVTNQRAEAGARQCHGEGRHGNRAKVKDAGIDVQGGKCLKRGETSGVRWWN